MKKPVALLAATDNWFSTTRIPIAFTEAGFDVDAVCPSGHHVRITKAVRNVYTFSTLSPAASLRAAIHSSSPDLIVPCTEDALEAMLALKRSAKDSGLHALIEHSIGSLANEANVTSRVWLLEAAAKAGVRLPATAEISDLEALRSWIGRHTLPAVLKVDGTCSGAGVQMVNSASEAEEAFQGLRSLHRLPRAVKRAAVNCDFKPALNLMQKKQPVVSIQQFVKGRDANIAFACWKGEMIGGIALEVLRTTRKNGAASVVRPIEQAEMMSSSARFAAHLNLSGIFGMDFVLEHGTDAAYLIEVNPRVPQGSHLALGSGRDLPSALLAALTGKPAVERHSGAAAFDTISYFPSEWRRDPESQYIRNGYHDIPWSEPRLIERMIADRPKSRLIPTRDSWMKLRARLPLLQRGKA